MKKSFGLNIFLASVLILNFLPELAGAAEPDYVAQIRNAPLFAKPLEWAGKQEPTSAESSALYASMSQFETTDVNGGLSGLEHFLSEHPQSPWTPALNINLAEYYRTHGRYSLALSHWEAAWNALKVGTKPEEQTMAVRTIAGWTRLLASLGEKEKIIARIAELDASGLPLGEYAPEINATKEGLAMMRAKPSVSYRCGSIALGNMALALGKEKLVCDRFFKLESPDGGFHFNELIFLAHTNGMEVEAVKRPVGGQIIVPSVIHWKLNHYAAITGKQGELYRVEDPTFKRHVLLDAATIDAEAGGEFLVLKDAAPAAWVKMSGAECAAVYGKGFPNLIDDGDDDGPATDCGGGDGNDDSADDSCDPPTANDGAGSGGDEPPPPCCGMPQWSVSEPYISLWVKDVPLLYRQSNGKWMQLKLSYKSNKTLDEIMAVQQVGGFGDRWSCNWLGLLASGGSPDTLVNHLSGGGTRAFDTTGLPDYKTARRLISNTTKQPESPNASLAIGTSIPEIQTPSGSLNSYRYSIGNNFSGTKHLLTERINRYGRVLQKLNYQYVGNTARLIQVLDIDGKTNTLAYNNPGAYSNLVTSVTDPYGRTAYFKYDQNGLLTNIVDMQGMSSSFKYDGNHNITDLVTPYGTNSFKYNEGFGSSSQNELVRSLKITEATGEKQLYAYRDNSPDSIPFPADGYTTYRFSYHWNRSQYAALSSAGKVNVMAMTTADYQKAPIKHWLHGASSQIETVSDALDSMADAYDASLSPSPGSRPNCVSYTYDGVNGGSGLKRVLKISQNNAPTAPAMSIGRNAWGRPTNTVYYHEGNKTASYTNFYDADGRILQQETGPRGEWTRRYGYHPVYANLLTSVTNAAGDVIRYTHDTNTMKLTSTTFPGGLVRTNIYYTSGTYKGFLQMQADIGVRTNYFTYDKGNVSVQTDELGLVTTNTYDNLNRLVNIAFPDNTTISNLYDKLEVVASKDRLDQWTYFVFNRVRQLLAVTNVNGQVTRYDYCGCGSPSTILRGVSGDLLLTQYTYDIGSRLISIFDSNDYYVVSYAYDDRSRVKKVTDSGGRQLELTYAQSGLNSEVSLVKLGGQTLLTREFDEYGRLTNSVDRNGVMTVQDYDFLDRVVARQMLGGTGEQTGLEHFEYNALGLTNYFDALNHLTSYVRDAAGRVLRETNANKEILRFTYNPADELLTLTDAKNQVTKWGYDTYGRVTNKIDAANNTLFTYQYDALDRLTRRWGAAKGNTDYVYDELGNLIWSIPENTYGIQYRYDIFNRLTNMVDDLGSTAFKWSPGGQLLSESGPWDAARLTNAYTDRLRTKLVLEQPATASWTQTYDYDGLMRLTNVVSPAGQFAYEYPADSASDLVRLLHLPGDTGNFNIFNEYDGLARLTNTLLTTPLAAVANRHAYAYDDGSQRTRQGFTADNYVNYTYDNIGQLKTAKGYEANATPRQLEKFGYAYDAAWNLSQRTNNALVQTFAVNNLNELTTATRSGTLTVAGATTKPAASVTVDNTAAEVYADGAFAATGFPLNNGNNTFSALAFDATGNVAQDSVTANLPATVGYEYDLNGNLIADSTRWFAYDGDNQLVSVWQTNVWRVDYQYDGLMRKRIAKDYTWSGSAWTQTNTTLYLYDGMLVIQERSGTTNRVTYTRGLDLSGSVQGAGGIGGLLARTANQPSADTNRLYVTGAGWSGANRVYVWNATANRYDGITQNYISTYANGSSTYWGLYYDTVLFYYRPGTDANGTWSTVTGTWAHPPAPTVRYGTNLYATVYYHADGNGNVTALVDASGTVTGRYSYDAYGGLLTMSGVAAAANTQRFSSKEWCAKPGIYYYGYRFYDPNLQRWINRDPMEEYGGINLYEFVAGNPMSLYDPYGLSFLDDAANTCSAIGDNLTFGLTDVAREGLGWNEGVDKDSKAYTYTDNGLTAAQLATGLPGLVKAGVRQGIKQGVKAIEKEVGHHTIPKASIKKLPAKLQKHPDVRGGKGRPNIRKIPEKKHKEIHSSCDGDYYPGGKYNKRADELIDEYTKKNDGGITPEDIKNIRQQLINEFDL